MTPTHFWCSIWICHQKNFLEDQLVRSLKSWPPLFAHLTNWFTKIFFWCQIQIDHKKWGGVTIQSVSGCLLVGEMQGSQGLIFGKFGQKISKSQTQILRPWYLPKYAWSRNTFELWPPLIFYALSESGIKKNFWSTSWWDLWKVDLHFLHISPTGQPKFFFDTRFR